MRLVTLEMPRGQLAVWVYSSVRSGGFRMDIREVELSDEHMLRVMSRRPTLGP